jgi:hypothetical protein
LEGCERKFLKVAGMFVHGKWFCGEECSNNDPETVQLNELYDKGIEFSNPDE